METVTTEIPQSKTPSRDVSGGGQSGGQVGTIALCSLKEEDKDNPCVILTKVGLDD